MTDKSFFNLCAVDTDLENLEVQLCQIQSLCAKNNTTKCGFKKTRYLVQKLHKNQLQSLDIQILVQSILLCRLHYENRKYCVKVDACLQLLFFKLLPEKEAVIRNAIYSFLTEKQIWQHNTFCMSVFIKLSKRAPKTEAILRLFMKAFLSNEMLLESAMVTIAKIVQNKSDVSTQMIIQMFLESFETETKFSALNKPLEECMYGITKNLKSEERHQIIYTLSQWIIAHTENDSNVDKVGDIIKHTARCTKTDIFENSIGSALFRSLLKMLTVNSERVRLLGNKILCQLLDRHNYSQNFTSPQIFSLSFEFTFIDGIHYRAKDKDFVKENRENLNKAIECSLLNARTKENLENSYQVLCLLAMEVKCAYVTATIAYILMVIQDKILECKELSDISEFHLHACIASIMSLLCRIHKAKNLYEYVNSIILIRKRFAPQLNPPLKDKYYFEQHHIPFHKPELYFQDWWIRYGLWTTFRMPCYQKSQETYDNPEFKMLYNDRNRWFSSGQQIKTPRRKPTQISIICSRCKISKDEVIGKNKEMCLVCTHNENPNHQNKVNLTLSLLHSKFKKH